MVRNESLRWCRLQKPARQQNLEKYLLLKLTVNAYYQEILQPRQRSWTPEHCYTMHNMQLMYII